MSSNFKLSNTVIKENIKLIQAYMHEINVDVFFMTSFDQYLNEYVPMENCHRYYFTGFSGSTAEVIIPREGKVKLYVDGRYHEQADLECDLDQIEVVKTGMDKGNIKVLKDDLVAGKYKKVGFEANRTPAAFYEYLVENFDFMALNNDELTSVVNFEKMPPLGKVNHLPRELRGSDTNEKLSKIIANKNEAYFITTTDSLAWLANCRGYHLPYLSSFLGKGLATFDKLYVFLDKGVEFECHDPTIEFINCDNSDLKPLVTKILANYEINKMMIDKRMLNAQAYLILENIMGAEKLFNKQGGLTEYHSIKEEGEIKVIKDSFQKADQAIFNTIKWVKNQRKEGNEVSELDLYNQTTVMYKEQGAIDQSFGTIAGVDANGSIIHYSDPKPNVMIKDNSMILLDSGGYFASGFATDTTRTFIGGAIEASEEHKEIYTLVLKSILQLQNAVFKAGTKSNGLDAICRQPLFQVGYDYAHGTGHGVGIHVHEGGVSISSGRAEEFKPGQVVSMEPGIYIPGFGGVRLENIALVKKHAKFEGFLQFENLVYIGFEPLLINKLMLSIQENVWLEEYEAECSKRGTSFR
ncbi:MAG: M24 family metallopeptidase [Halobacteriovoraceae bacterium]|jgi:Xaa-Pro aminopeptidase|nr:M24 family metallopeptidase [Halobacteriovoraceae bacterium]